MEARQADIIDRIEYSSYVWRKAMAAVAKEHDTGEQAMLIENSTWADLHESYGHVQIADFHQADKDRIFKEATNSLSDKLKPMMDELLNDRFLKYYNWEHKRGAFDEMKSILDASIMALAQDEADEWEGLDCE